MYALVLQARAWPHLLLHCGSPPSPRWRLKSSKLFHICLLESFRFGSTLLPSPIFPIPSTPHCLPFKSPFRVIIALKFVSHPLVSGSVGSPWFFFPSSLVSGRCSCHISSCAGGTRSKDAREVLLLIACHSASVPHKRVIGLVEAHRAGEGVNGMLECLSVARVDT
jgi:hypothetical protein